MSFEPSEISKKAHMHRERAMGERNSDLTKTCVVEVQQPTPEINGDKWLIRIVVIFFALMLAGSGYIAIDSQYHRGTTKLGKVVELYGTKAMGMGGLNISFAILFLTTIATRKHAIGLACVSMSGIAVSLWFLFP